jgi:hypothetical protein
MSYISPKTFRENLYIFEKQKINLFNNIFQDICIYIYSDYYYITTITCTYQKLSASEFASVTRALSHSHLSCPSVTHFDFRMHFFEGPGSSILHHVWLIM